MSPREFVGIDPDGLACLANHSEGAADRIIGVARALDLAPGRFGPTAAGVGPRLRATAARIVEYAAAMRWRAGAIALLRDRGSGHLLDAATFAGFRSPSATAHDPGGETRPEPDALADLSPSAVAAVFSGMAPSVGERLARSHPHLIGSLDGAPARLRYLANRLLILEHIGRLEELLADVDAPDPPGWLRLFRSPFPFQWHSVGELRESVICRIRSQIDRYRTWIDEDRQILLFESRGDGKVVEVFGDLQRAEHVAVVIPGMANDLDGFDAEGGGLRDAAARLYEAAADVDHATATIAWLGYDPPDGADAALRRSAADGAPALQRFVEGIDPGGSDHLTVIAHSYGSVLAGIAAGHSLSVDDLVVVGSPGTTLDTASAARLRPGGRVWAALATADPIAAGISPAELPPWSLSGLLGPVWFAADMSNGPETLWHGANPASPGYGALRISTAGSSGHSAYFESGSLDNLALIVSGRYTDVDLHN